MTVSCKPTAVAGFEFVVMNMCLVGDSFKSGYPSIMEPIVSLPFYSVLLPLTVCLLALTFEGLLTLKKFPLLYGLFPDDPDTGT